MTRQTRREFLENSMLAAAAAAMAGGSLIPQAGAKEQSSSPNERLRVGILGLNGRGGAHRDAFARRRDTEIVAVCDPDIEVGMRLGVAAVEKETGKKPEFYQDLRKLLDDKSIDIISIATPNHWHALAAIWAIQAGKDVYVEKPVSHNVSEGRRIVDAARRHEKICQAGTQSRSSVGTRELMDFLHSGGIGEVKLARGLCYKDRKSIGPRGTYQVPSSVDYNLWCGPAPMKPLTRRKFHYDWHWQWDYGNGDLGNQGIHQMDLARWGLGVSDLGQGVISYGGRFGYEDAGETANTQVSVHDYGDKTLVFEVRGLPTAPFKTAAVGVIFEGTNGYAVMGSYEGGVVFDPSGTMIKKFHEAGDHFENFVNAVRSRRVDDLHADILDGHLSSALCHLGNVSYRLGEGVSVGEAQRRLESAKQKSECLETFERAKQHLADNHVDLNSAQIQFGAPLAVDGKAETFMGDMSSQANPLLTREYRKGFEVPATAQLV
ncbi:MAG TPA: Gfo/Idh/MocA family oxidoreductase [Planctomycetaceae bacterium]|nr:Gfo/Idh/MocA family oxidoreductase [Planctomycetaceae bacterium]